MQELLKNFWQLVVAAIVGGVATFFFQTILARWYSEIAQARHKLQFYSKHLFASCSACRERFEGVAVAIGKAPKVPTPQGEGWQKHELSRIIEELALPLEDNATLEWFTKKGYLLVSSAYLFTSVVAWIGLYERDVAVLDFGHEIVTNEFLKLIESFKRNATKSGSYRNNLYYHYLDGAGTLLVKGTSLMSFSEFCRVLFDDRNFRSYFDEVFCYLHDVAAGRHTAQIKEMSSTLEKIMRFLVKHTAIPKAWMQFGVNKIDPLYA